jgi:hypothetical protein
MQRLDAIVPTIGTGVAIGRRREFGIHVENRSATQILQSLEGAGLREKRRRGDPRGRPGVLEPRVLDLAHDVETPVLLTGWDSDTGEGNANLDLVAEVGDVAFGLPRVVGREIHGIARTGGRAETRCFVLHPFAQYPIGLDAERIHGEDICRAVIV